MPLPCVVLTRCPGSFYHVLEEIRGSQAYMTWPALPSAVPWVSCFHHTGRAMSNTWYKVAWEGKGKKTSTPELQRQYSSYLYWIYFWEWFAPVFYALSSSPNRKAVYTWQALKRSCSGTNIYPNTHSKDKRQEYGYRMKFKGSNLLSTS